MAELDDEFAEQQPPCRRRRSTLRGAQMSPRRRTPPRPSTRIAGFSATSGRRLRGWNA